MKKQNIIIKIILIALIIIAFFGTGAFGTFLKNIFLYLFGNTYYFVGILIIIYIFSATLKKKVRKKVNRFLLTTTFIFLSIDILLTLIKTNGVIKEEFLSNQILFTKIDSIGLFQAILVSITNNLFGILGIYILSMVLFLIGLSLVLDFDKMINKFIKWVSKKIKGQKSKTKEEKIKAKEQKLQEKKLQEQKLQEQKANVVAKASENKVEDEEISKEEPEFKPIESDFFEMRIPIRGRDKYKEEVEDEQTVDKTVEDDKSKDQIEKIDEQEKSIEANKEELENKDNDVSLDVMHKNEKFKYKVPSISLLNDIKNNEKKYSALKKTALTKKKNLVAALKSFNIKAEVKNIIVGSTITKYELQPEPGQKVSKFSNLSNDLAMSLEASSVRIEAPIPGKSLVGIEIPNEEKLVVGLKDILKDDKQKNNKLEVALGQDINSESKFLDIAKTPHLLVAGATGSGKSVCINSIITSILLKATPEEVKFLLIDPKKVELTPYEGIPHLIAPVITDPEKAAVSLNKLVLEMEKRYELFTETKTRNISSYNEKIQKEGGEKLPYIVAIIDELADLMMVASSEIETSISRIAQKARAAGIHMILATQRPSTDVITGLIKSNIPSRISFMVSSAIDSRTILDSKGAEKLLGNGDMLLSRAGSHSFERIQGGYLSDEEISSVVSFITDQFKQEDVEKFYTEEFTKLEEVETNDKTKEDQNDSLEEQAIQIGIDAGRISTSLLQRKLKIGYNKAADLMESLEDKGYVTKQEGNKGRKIILEKVNKQDEENSTNQE